MSGKRGPERVVVRADERRGALQVEVVRDEHEVSRRPRSSRTPPQAFVTTSVPTPSRAEHAHAERRPSPARAPRRGARGPSSRRPAPRRTCRATSVPACPTAVEAGQPGISPYGISTASSTASAKPPRPAAEHDRRRVGTRGGARADRGDGASASRSRRALGDALVVARRRRTSTASPGSSVTVQELEVGRRDRARRRARGRGSSRASAPSSRVSKSTTGKVPILPVWISVSASKSSSSVPKPPGKMTNPSAAFTNIVLRA